MLTSGVCKSPICLYFKLPETYSFAIKDKDAKNPHPDILGRHKKLKLNLGHDLL